MQSEVEQLKSVIKEKQKDIVELRSTVEAQQEELNRKDANIKQLSEDNENLNSEKTHLLTQVKRLG
jgi:predicted nuclease with TOPRIM domain